MKIKGCIITVAALPLMSGCWTTFRPISEYDSVAQQFNQAVAVVQVASQEQLSSRANTERILAVTCRVHGSSVCAGKNTLQPVLDNDKGDPLGFARMACAGTDIAKAYGDISYTATFSSSLEEILKKPDDNFIAVVKHIQELKEKEMLIQTPDPLAGEKAYGQCVQRVKTLTTSVTWEGRDIPNEKPEESAQESGLIALSTELKALFDTLDKAATATAQMVDEEKRKNAFRNIVLLNAETVRSKIADDGPIAKGLDKQFQERLITSLRVPFTTYQELRLLLSQPLKDEHKVYSLATRLNSEFNEFDRLRKAPSPLTVIHSLRLGYTKLEQVANNEATPKQALAYLEALAKQLKEVTATLVDVEKQIKSIGSTATN